MGTVKEILADITPFLTLSEVSSSYYGKGRSWLANKINENTINGVRYHLNREEIDALADIMDNLSVRFSDTSKQLRDYSNRLKRQSGVYFTRQNPFNHPLFLEWYHGIKQPTIAIEPFAGSCNIPMLLKEIGIEPQWQCYDISPLQVEGYHVVKRDCIANMPNGRIIITNPPYLAKNSANRRGLDYPETTYQDIYLYCLERMLKNGKYIAAILPESFITSNLFQERLYGVISLKDDYFADTNCPVCLALFNPRETDTFKVYSSEEYLGDYKTLINNTPFRTPNHKPNWRFNVPTGSIGVQCIDRVHDKICFLPGDMIKQDSIVESSRSYTRIEGLPEGIDLTSFIESCNEILAEYRDGTKDILLTSFKGKREDGYYRRRIDFGTIKAIMDTAMCRLECSL